MATIKKRINITLADEADRLLSSAARRDNMPIATKAAELLRLALEIEEDSVWNTLAKMRDKRGARFISHEKVWG